MSDFEYEVEDGKVTITGYTGNGGDVVIPDEIEGLPVTCIGDNAFCYCTGLTSITLPEGCTTIGYYVFSGCTGLTSITLPNSITTISVGAFKGCPADITIRRDTEQKKLHAIYALVQANRNYTAPEAFELVCEKIMELKEDAK